jgi:3-oxoacyl-[acyl-carrier-protein] synthase II
MIRPVVITGLGPLSALGCGIEPTWQALCAGQCGIDRITAFDPAGFACQLAGEVRDFKANQVVPKFHRKAVKVMARDIELAVGGAHYAAGDAHLLTRGNIDPKDKDTVPTYEPSRVGVHIGAALIAAEVNELTYALSRSTDDAGQFDYHKFGGEGMSHITPLWLLKYLPNMLACHVTIIHDAQGPSNTITCNTASGHLSIGESLRVIQRGAADLCFCGGMESRINPLNFLRVTYTHLLNSDDNDHPATAMRSMCQSAQGAILGEGGAIMVIESKETWQARAQRDGADAYAQILGFGASQSVHLPSRNMHPDPDGRGIAASIRAALRDAAIEPDQIDLIVPNGMAALAFDGAEANAMRTVFGDRLPNIPVTPIKSMLGWCGAGAGGLDVAVAAKAIKEQQLPARINCDSPLENVCANTAPSGPATINYALSLTASFGGQNAAIVLGRLES